ncbi:MAG: type I-E CRISPR-associated protein Cse2/CasB [Streptosporangiaceae bacterium]
MAEINQVPGKADQMAREVTRLVRHNPADRAALRHSLGRPPEEAAPAVHRIVVPYLADNAADALERAFYAVAALIASQPRQARDAAGTENGSSTRTGDAPAGEPGARAAAGLPARRPNLGESFALAVHGKGLNAGSMENRLHLLARQDLDGLYRQLPRLVLQLRGDLVRIDWGVLIRDLTRWAADPKQVAKEWMQSYYRASERLTRTSEPQAGAAPAAPGNEES